LTDTKNDCNSHSEECLKSDRIKSREDYERLYRQSLEDPETFWAAQAEKYLTYNKKWDFVLRYDFEEPRIEWFGKGILNAAYNCLDRHLEAHGNKIAYYWEGDNPSERKSVTYAELYEQVNKFAAVLKSKGVGRGDRVIIYLPMIVELPVAMLACARIGAVHSVVFTGFSAKTLAKRILDCGAETVITADVAYRAGRTVPLKQISQYALKRCPAVKNFIVLNRAELKCDEQHPGELGWQDAIADPNLPSFIPPEQMDAEDPLFILYTGDSTGSPKGLVHTHGGYLLYAAMTTHLLFDLKAGETFWCTADIGWITGHTHGVYGLLLNAATGILFEGVPFYPDYGRYWEMIARYRTDKLYTAPAVIRSLAQAGESHIGKHDISSLKLLGAAGDALDPKAYQWFHRHAGMSRCPIIDTYLQIETGGVVLTPLPGVEPFRPGSCSFPFFGIDAVILDDTGEEARYPNQEGVLCIQKPWPGMARTIYGDHERFAESYFSQIPGMFFTSDGASKDEDGYYRIIGRIDEVINVSGHRIGTAEIESALSRHDLTAEAAAVGYPHPIKGQGIYAFVTLKPGAAKSDELKKELVQSVRDEIGPIVTIDVIQWADALPKTRSGKIIRHILDKIAAGKIKELGDTSAIIEPAVIENLIKERMSLR